MELFYAFILILIPATLTGQCGFVHSRVPEQASETVLSAMPDVNLDRIYNRRNRDFDDFGFEKDSVSIEYGRATIVYKDGSRCIQPVRRTCRFGDGIEIECKYAVHSKRYTVVGFETKLFEIVWTELTGATVEKFSPCKIEESGI